MSGLYPLFCCTYEPENKLGALVCMHVHEHTHTRVHAHTLALFILLLVHLPSLPRTKGRLRIAWLKNGRTTGLNTDSFDTHNSELPLMGFLPHFKACCFLSVTRLIHMRILTFCSSQALSSQANGFLSACTCSPDTFIYSHSLGVTPFITRYLLLLKITSNVKVVSIASVPAICRNC